MRVKAKDLKINDIAKYGNVWVKIENLSFEIMKNGKEYVRVTGTRLESVIKRSNGYIHRIPQSRDYEFCPKINTWVNIK